MRKEVGRLERGEFLGDERLAAGEPQNRSLRSDYRRGHTCAGAAGIALAGPAYHGRALPCEFDRSISPPSSPVRVFSGHGLPAEFQLPRGLTHGTASLNESNTLESLFPPVLKRAACQALL